MLQFLLFIFDALAGFAMLSLGLAYTSEAPDCAAEIRLVPADYFIDEEANEAGAADCVGLIDLDTDAVQVFRI